MIRFRNPGSDWDTLIAIFKLLYEELKDEPYFDNDAIREKLSKGNLMASSGFTGDKAVEFGANRDKTRDKTYNNAKMYAEIFRLLGLISAVNNSASQYRFTYIGDHFAAEGTDHKALIEQCILGLNNPNRIMDVSYKESIRFFSCVLLAMEKLNDVICRDEMILGPMSINDNDGDEFNKMIAYITELRKCTNSKRIKNELKKLAKSQTENKKEGMSVESVQNCTRFPIAVLKYCGWVDDYMCRMYGRSTKYMKLTKHGKDTIAQIKASKDIRLADYEKMSNEQKKALIRLGTYQMLARAKFDTSSVQKEMEADKKVVESVSEGREILFSPYQTIEYTTVNDALNIKTTTEKKRDNSEKLVTLKGYANGVKIGDSILIERNAAIKKELVTTDVNKFVLEVERLSKSLSVEQIVQELAKKHEHDNKGEYYPLIETLFRIIGVDCRKSRDGVVGERWDAMIRDSKRSIPIEIKSPGEEMNISIKAIRQALENKIVLLSRGTYATDKETTSFAVGYNAPNNRAEVAELIFDIKETFGYKIAVFDIFALLRLAVNVIIEKKGIDVNKLYELEGIVDVTCLEK